MFSKELSDARMSQLKFASLPFKILEECVSCLFLYLVPMEARLEEVCGVEIGNKAKGPGAAPGIFSPSTCTVKPFPGEYVWPQLTS